MLDHTISNYTIYYTIGAQQQIVDVLVPLLTLVVQFVITAVPGLTVAFVGYRVSTEVTFGRGDLCVCPLGGFTGAHESLVSSWRGVPQGSPEGHTLRALLLRGTSVLH